MMHTPSDMPAGLPDSDPDPDALAVAGPTTPTTTPTDRPAPAGIRYASAPRRAHGTGVRGEMLSRQSTQFEGRFGRIFRTLPAAVHADQELEELAEAMTAELEDPPTPEDEIDEEENIDISAGYTYLGQFIDHDLTFDPASSLQRQNDPDGLVNFRTPRFDLDCLYGRGPDDQPYLYADDGVHMLLGRELTGSEHDPHARDVPRNTPNPNERQRALIGDPRNDENVIASQLHATMLRFHNRMVDVLTQGGDPPSFERAQREVRFHYQWVVLHDFLPTMIGEELLRDILPQLADDGRRGAVKAPVPNLQFFRWKKEPFIPIEFSVAAYRFGHSMVRPIYRLNTTLPERLPIFAENPDDSLVGFRAFPEIWAIDWNLFFKIDDSAPALGKDRVQPAYKIDTSLVNPLGHLPPSVVKGPPALAARNLLRGLRMSLPSGQSVAYAMGLPIIPDSELRVRKATEGDHDHSRLLTDISSGFADNAPLWCYILAEAQQALANGAPCIRLGPVGGRIVGEVFVGLMFGDSHSYLRQAPGWRPRDEFMRDGRFGMAELIRATRD
jgi:Animal haem peroxidase